MREHPFCQIITSEDHMVISGLWKISYASERLFLSYLEYFPGQKNLQRAARVDFCRESKPAVLILLAKAYCVFSSGSLIMCSGFGASDMDIKQGKCSCLPSTSASCLESAPYHANCQVFVADHWF